MKVLVIPDIHLKPWIFDRAEELMKTGKAERAVCLMDLPDDWDREFEVELYSEVFDRAIAFATDFQDTLWCYGNHELSYPWGKLESGYSPYAEGTVIQKLNELKDALSSPAQIAIVHRIDTVLFSHGGLSTKFVRSLGKRLVNSDVDEVIAAVNNASPEILWTDDSPLWLRPQYRKTNAFRADCYTQVVGHTPVEEIFEKDSIVSTDVFSTYRDGTQIGEPAMIVVDSLSGQYEKFLVEM